MTDYRDLTVIPLNTAEQLVIACDSSAGIGQKPVDKVLADPSLTAALCLRVPLLELLAVGAEPLAIIDLIGNEYDDTGRQMLAGIKAELEKAGLANIPINGSTEENIVTEMTTVGVTVVGKSKIGKLKFGRLEVDDELYFLGTPYVGLEVVAHGDELFSYADLQQIVATEGVVEALPVGSKGVLHEVQTLVKSSDLEVALTAERQSDPVLLKSAGPATVLIIALKPTYSSAIADKYQLTYLGKVTERAGRK